MFECLFGGGGLVEPHILEMMRIRTGHLTACTYRATVRLAPVSEQVKPKEPAIGVRDISTMTKAEALAALAGKIDAGKLSRREAFNITMRVDTDQDSSYPHALAYAEASSR